MTRIDELCDLVRDDRPDGGRRRRGHRAPRARQRVRGRPGTGAHQRPQPPRRDHRGSLRRRSDRAGVGRRQRRRRRPRRARRRHRRRPAAAPGPTSGRDPATSSSPSPPAATAGGATWGQVTATEAGFRGPRGRPIAGAIEHTAPCGPGSSGAPVLDRAGTGRRHQHPPTRARLLPRPRRRRGAARRRRGDGRGPELRAAAPRRGPRPRRRRRPAAPLRRARRARRAARARRRRRTRRRRRPASARATCSFAPATASCARQTTCSPCSPPSSRAVSWRSGSSVAPRS